MSEVYLMELKRHIIDGERTDLSEEEKRDLALRKRGGDAIYRYLHSNIVRSYWKDHPGYPLKKLFHAKGLLVCSIPIRKLSRATTYSDRVVRENIEEMEYLGHLKKNNEHTLKGQTVYILGTWKEEINENGKTIYTESLLRDKARDSYIKVKKIRKKIKENDYSMYNFEELYPEGMNAYFGTP